MTTICSMTSIGSRPVVDGTGADTTGRSGALPALCANSGELTIQGARPSTAQPILRCSSNFRFSLCRFMTHTPHTTDLISSNPRRAVATRPRQQHGLDVAHFAHRVANSFAAQTAALDAAERDLR